MIPILYEANETAFTSNGLGRLSDAITCKVVEERNGIFELNMTYPVNGIHFSDIQESRIILAKAHEGGLTQPFIIYRIEKPINGICTIKAEHISYRLSTIVVMPYSAGSLTAALVGIANNSATTNPFNFATDITSVVNFKLSEPRNARGLLGGESGSILDVYGQGEYEFSRFDVFLHSDRGADNGVQIRYGKNLTDIKNIVDMTGVYTGIVPYWTDGDTTVTLPEKVIMSTHASDFPYYILKTVDFSADYEEAPSEAQLRAKAESYVANNDGWKIKHNVTVSFVDLWNTEEYKDIAALERVQLCDIVHVIYGKLGVDFKTKVIKTDYNVLEERYNRITLGDTYYTLSSVLNDEIANSAEKTTTHLQKAIEHATKLIQGGLGGHVVFTVNADGEPQEICIMDTDDISTAVNVLRMNLNGIGFSTTGYAGQYTTAWTIDGHFNADFIDAGTIDADLIKAGVLQDENGTTTFDLTTGALYSENLTIDSTYFKLSNVGKITSINPDGHVITIENGVITGYYTDYDDPDEPLVQSAQLEIGNGYFNIIGKLALNGVVGVSGMSTYVKSLSYEENSLGSLTPRTLYTLGSATQSCSVSGGSVSVSGGTASGLISVSGMINGQYVTLYGNASLPVTGITATHTNPTVSIPNIQTVQNVYTGTGGLQLDLKYLKAVVANTGTVQSADGLIQSIT